MSDGSKIFENLNFLIVVTRFEQLESVKSIIDVLRENQCQICIVHKSFDTKSSTIPEDVKSWFANEVTEGNTIHFIISEDVNFPFYRVASVDFLIPVVKIEWIYNCIENRKHARTSLFSPDPRHIFKDFQVYVSRHSFNNSEYLFYTEAIHALGGTCVDFLSNKTSHLVTQDPQDPGISAVLNFGGVEKMKFVYPTWIIQSFKQISVAPEGAHEISPEDSIATSKNKLEDLWGRLNDTNFKITSNIWENHTFIIGMDISLNRDLYSTLIEFLQANGGTVHRHLDESDIAKTKADCYIGKSVSSKEYDTAENKKLQLGNLIWIFYMWSLNQFAPPTEKLIFSPFKRKLLETNQLITAYTNFFGQQRFYIQRLVNALGGFTTSELSRRNTHLLCRFPFGKKFETAKKWADKCVITNFLWLEECYRQSTRLDPLEPRFQQLPVEGGLRRTLGQMKWDHSELFESYTKPPSYEKQSKMQNTPLTSQNHDDEGPKNVEEPTPELRPTTSEPIEEPININEQVIGEENTAEEKRHITKDPIIDAHGSEKELKSNSIARELSDDSEVKRDAEHPQENQKESPNPDLLAKSAPEQEKFEIRPNLEGSVYDKSDNEERKPRLETISNEEDLSINKNDNIDIPGKPQGHAQDGNISIEPKRVDSQKNSPKDLQGIQELKEDEKSPEALQGQNEERMSMLNGVPQKSKEHAQPEAYQKEPKVLTEESEQPKQRQEESVIPINEQRLSQEAQKEQIISIKKEEDEQHEEPLKNENVAVEELVQYPESEKEPKEKTADKKEKLEETAPQQFHDSTGGTPAPSGLANENPIPIETAEDHTPSSETPKNELELQPQLLDENTSKSQTPPSTLTPSSSDQIHSGQGSRRAAKTKAARKLHDDIESLNEFQRNTKRKKTGNLLPGEIAELGKRKALENEAKQILLKVLPEENEITKDDNDPAIVQQHRPRKLPYHINAITTGVSDNIGELDMAILRLLGITIHNDITSENSTELNGVIAPKKIRTAKFLKSLSFHPLKYALTPKFLKDVLRIVHKGKKANLSLDLSRYYIPDTDHGKLLKLTSLPNKVFERAGISNVNIISDIPGGIDTISSILKAHGVKETKSIPAAHLNRLSLEDFALNDTDTAVTTEVSLKYIFLVNKATQVRILKKLTKNSNHSALAVAWDWFITSIFELEVDVNSSEHVIYRSG